MLSQIAVISVLLAASVQGIAVERRAGLEAGVNGRHKAAPFADLANVPSREYIATLPEISIDNYGAVANVNTTAAALANSQAIEAAVAASANSAGVAVIPAGSTYELLPVELAGYSDASLRIDGIVSAHTNISAWPLSHPGSYQPLFNIENTDGFALLGTSESLIEGHGLEWWWVRVLNIIDADTPTLVHSSNTTNMLVSGVRTSNSPRYNFYLGESHNLEISEVHIWTDWGGAVGFAEESGQLPSHEVARTTVVEALSKQLGLDSSSSSSAAAEAVDAWLSRLGAHGENMAAGASFTLRWLSQVVGSLEQGPEAAIPFPGIPMYPLNTDGLDIAGQTMWIHDCNVTNWDDSYCVKPQPMEGSGCSEDIRIEDSIVLFGVGASMGSVPPNSGVNCIRRVEVRNISFTAPTKTLYVKTNGGNSGTGLIANVHYSEIRADEGFWYPIYVGPQQQEEPDGGGDGWWPATQPRVTVQNITFDDIEMTDVLWPQPGVLRCNSTNPCTGIDFAGVNLTSTVWNATTFEWVCEQTLGQLGGVVPVPKCSNGNRRD